MKILRTIYNAWSKNAQLINIIFLIIFAAQLLSFFKVKIISETIIPIAYLVSVFFLYKGFKENQTKNRMELGKEIFENYKKEIKNVLPTFIKKDEVQQEYNIFIENKRSKFHSEKIYDIYDSVINSIVSLSRSKRFKNYVERMNNKDKELLLIKDDEELNKLNYYYNELDLMIRANLFLTGEYLNIYRRVYTDREFMSTGQLKLLLKETEYYIESYFNICTDYINNRLIWDTYFINNSIEIDTKIKPFTVVENRRYQSLIFINKQYLLFESEFIKLKNKLISSI